MHYYELEFYATDGLLKDWGRYDDEILCQTFYVKTEKPIKSVKKMKKHLRETFAPSKEFHDDLINCLKPSTVDALARFQEIDAGYFESCCGVPA